MGPFSPTANATKHRPKHGRQPCDQKTKVPRKGPRFRLHVALEAHAGIHVVLGSPQPQPRAPGPGRIMGTKPGRKQAQDPYKPADYDSVADAPRGPYSPSCGVLDPSSCQVREGGLEPPCPKRHTALNRAFGVRGGWSPSTDSGKFVLQRAVSPIVVHHHPDQSSGFQRVLSEARVLNGSAQLTPRSLSSVRRVR